MLTRRFRSLAALALTLSVTPLLLGCGDDDPNPGGGTGPTAPAFVGTWNATSFVVNGTLDLIANGASISFTFTGNTYSFTVTGDPSGVVCDPGPNCSESGGISSTSGTITFDPGTPDASTFDFTVSGSTLTISGTVEGNAISATFQKV